MDAYELTVEQINGAELSACEYRAVRRLLDIVHGETGTVRLDAQGLMWACCVTTWDACRRLLGALQAIDLIRYHAGRDQSEGAIVAFNGWGHQEALLDGMAMPSVRREGYIYVVRAVGTDWYKIGQTIRPDTRLKQLALQSPFEIAIVACIQVADMKRVETQLHEQFHDKRMNGEWFCLNEDDSEQVHRWALAQRSESNGA